MGVSNLSKAFLQVAGAVGLLWLNGAQGQALPGSCEDLAGVWQTMSVSGQPSAPYDDGKVFICFNPEENCYLAVADGDLGSFVPFTAEESGENVDIASAKGCGGYGAVPGKAFSATISPENPGSGCLNKLTFNEGAFAGGRLVQEPQGPAVLIEGEIAVLLDDPVVGPNSLNIPGCHSGYGCFTIKVPIVNGGMVVRNETMGKTVANGSVNNTCGARLGPPAAPIPTLPQYAIIALIMGLLFAAVRITRHRMSV